MSTDASMIMKVIGTRNRRLAGIVAILLMAAAASQGQDQSSIFPALSAEASNCLVRIRSDLSMLGNRFSIMKGVEKESIFGGLYRYRHGSRRGENSFFLSLNYNRDVTTNLVFASVSCASTVKPNRNGLIFTAGIGTTLFKDERTRIWDIPIGPKDDLYAYYFVDAGKGTQTVIAEVKAVAEKHLTTFIENAKKLVGETK